MFRIIALFHNAHKVNKQMLWQSGLDKQMLCKKLESHLLSFFFVGKYDKFCIFFLLDHMIVCYIFIILNN